VSWKQSRIVFFAGVAALLVIVGLLAFGEEARQGRYHLDGGRGWDLPTASSIDVSPVHFYPAIRPKISIVVDRNTISTADRVLPSEVHIPRFVTSTIAVKRRPPPEV